MIEGWIFQKYSFPLSLSASLFTVAYRHLLPLRLIYFPMKYFGTDGIRSLFGDELKKNAYKLGRALSKRGGKIVLAIDGREGGEELARYFVGGVNDNGGDAIYLGVAPTPALAYATKGRFDYGVEITASHNPKEYNGLKVFDVSGEKLFGERVEDIERDMDEIEVGNEGALPSCDLSPLDGYLASFDGEELPVSIVVDAAGGASRRFAEDIFAKRGINARFIDDGKEINQGCGSENPSFLKKALRDGEIGVAFDGDGDRLLFAAGKEIWSGERLLYVLAKNMKERGLLRGKVAVTEMANKGLITSLKALGVEVVKCKVGDVNVYSKLKEVGGNLGGEPSGHILVDGEQADALKNAIRICEIIYSNKNCDEGFVALPERSFVLPLSENVLKTLNDRADIWRGYLGEKGSIKIRVSGTEPVIRVKVEAVKESLVKEIASDLRVKSGK